MAQIVSFRKGWESENLARYFFSRFSFIANPSTISDDVGTDYYCTIFFKNRKGKTEYLIPKSFFGIQIKSNFNAISATNKIDYLSGLQFPYFVGVADRKNFLIHIFSDEYIPMLFSSRTPKTLKIKLCTREEDDREYYEIKERRIILNFPKIFEISINISDHDLNKITFKFNEICGRIQEHISSRMNKQYIFYNYEKKFHYVLAGKDSAQTFRDNMFKRLVEAFLNLGWIYRNDRENFKIEEFRCYEKLLNSLSSAQIYIPDYVIKSYCVAKSAFD